ncbi:MAG: hypothetical protein IJH77_01175 [Mogibacterium sp.]|nr:hypothetical protein [Mogibacterium sp.]
MEEVRRTELDEWETDAIREEDQWDLAPGAEDPEEETSEPDTEASSGEADTEAEQTCLQKAAECPQTAEKGPMVRRAGIVEAYRRAADPDVLRFIRHVGTGKTDIRSITVGFYSRETAETIEHLTGRPVQGNRVLLDVKGVRHIANRHGRNGAQDESMANPRDLARIGYVLMNYDEISFKGMTASGYPDEDGKPSPVVEIRKRIGKDYFIIGAVNSADKGRNYIVSAYIDAEQAAS